MSRMRTWLGVALPLSLILAASGSIAAIATPTVTVTGSGKASADWVVTKPTSLDIRHTRFTTTGRWVALAVEDLASRKIVALAADAPVLQVQPRGPVVGNVAGPPGSAFTVLRLDLSRGRYRMRLLSDGKATARIPVLKGSGVRLVTSRAAEGSVTLIDPRAEPIITAVRHTSPVTLARGGQALFVAQENTQVYAGAVQDVCVRRDPGTCHTTGVVDITLVQPGLAVGDGWSRIGINLTPGLVPPGGYVFDDTWVTVGVDSSFFELMAVVRPS